MTRVLVLVVVLLAAAACGGSPTPTLDVIERNVAQALAVAVTLTAMAPTEAATSTPALTPTATRTPTSASTATPTPTSKRAPTCTPTPTQTPKPTPALTCTMTASPPPKPLATRAPTAVPRVCSPFPALVEFSSELPADATIALSGPEKVRLAVPAGGKARYCLVPGEYAYIASASGYSPGTGADFFGYTPQDCICRKVYIVVSPPTPDPCEANPYSWQCRWPMPGRDYCECQGDLSLYNPATLKPGTKTWKLKEAAAHCTNPSLCVILPAPGATISGSVHVVG